MEQPKRNLKKSGVRETVEVNSRTSKTPNGNIVAASGEDLTYTPLNLEGKERRDKAGFKGSETEGVKVDKDGNSTAKTFSNKYIRTPNGSLKIIGDDGTTIAEGRERSGAMQDALKKSQKKVLVTNTQRNNNARGNNLYGGLADNITDSETRRLESDKQITSDAPIRSNLQKAIDNENKDRTALAKKGADKVASTRKVYIKKPTT